PTTRFDLKDVDTGIYTVRHKSTGAVKIVTDPGRALITGKWKDVGRFKGPILRGLAGRAPVLPQRLSGDSGRCRELLRYPLQSRSDRVPKGGPGGLPENAVAPVAGPLPRRTGRFAPPANDRPTDVQARRSRPYRDNHRQAPRLTA